MQTISLLFDIFKSTKSDKDKTAFDTDLVKKVVSMFSLTSDMGHIINRPRISWS